MGRLSSSEPCRAERHLFSAFVSAVVADRTSRLARQRRSALATTDPSSRSWPGHSGRIVYKCSARMASGVLDSMIPTSHTSVMSATREDTRQSFEEKEVEYEWAHLPTVRVHRFR